MVFWDQVYPGQHDAIIDRATFDTMQQRLDQSRVDRVLQTHAAEPSLRSGLVWDMEGRQMSPSHAKTRGKRYRYHISQRGPGDTKDAPLFRLSANDLERRILKQRCQAMEDQVTAAINGAALGADDIEHLQASRDDGIKALIHGATRKARRPVSKFV